MTKNFPRAPKETQDQNMTETFTSCSSQQRPQYNLNGFRFRIPSAQLIPMPLWSEESVARTNQEYNQDQITFFLDEAIAIAQETLQGGNTFILDQALAIACDGHSEQYQGPTRQ